VPLSNFVPRGFEFVHHSIALLYHEVPNPNIRFATFSSLFVAKRPRELISHPESLPLRSAKFCIAVSCSTGRTFSWGRCNIAGLIRTALITRQEGGVEGGEEGPTFMPSILAGSRASWSSMSQNSTTARYRGQAPPARSQTVQYCPVGRARCVQTVAKTVWSRGKEDCVSSLNPGLGGETLCTFPQSLAHTILTNSPRDGGSIG
jgi:hypothetical protein